MIAGDADAARTDQLDRAWMIRLDAAVEIIEDNASLRYWEVVIDALRRAAVEVYVSQKCIQTSDKSRETSHEPPKRLPCCPCGKGGEPWHYPRSGICTVGMEMRAILSAPPQRAEQEQ